MSNGNKGLPPQARKAMLDEEMGNGDGEVESVPLESTVPVTPAAPAVALPALPQGDLTAILQAFVAVMAQSNVGTAEAIRDALSNAATMAREPIPENKVDPGKSVYSHPDGDLVTPRTKLKCKMFLGVYDEDNVVKPAFEIFEDTSTENERVALNLLEPGVYDGIERNDGARATWRIRMKRDENRAPIELVIAVPQPWLGRDQFHQMPGQLNFVRQLLAATRETTAAA